MMQEIVSAYNSTTGNSEKTTILSSIVNNYSFQELSKFNWIPEITPNLMVLEKVIITIDRMDPRIPYLMVNFLTNSNVTKEQPTVPWQG